VTKQTTEHWNTVYRTRDDAEVSWFDPGASESFETVASLIAPGDPVLDVGAGASRLVDRLLAEGYGPVDVLDLSEAALEISRKRLGALGDGVGWIAADITAWTPDRTWALWHDRAVFHFLTGSADRAAYIRALARALRHGGHAVISTFADDGPEICSGLPVVRYAPDELAAEFDNLASGAFMPLASSRHVHRTPGGGEQRFQTSLFRRR